LKREDAMRALSDIVCHQQPLILQQDCSVRDACVQMRDRRVGSVLVTNAEGRLVGILTGRDVVRRVASKGHDAADTSLADAMTVAPTTMTPGQTAIEALRLMWDGGFRHVPVVADGRIVGVVSRGDFKADEQDRLDQEREVWEHLR
jgi:CBS domain-containing protein